MSKFLDLEGLGYYTTLVKGRYDTQIEDIKTNILLVEQMNGAKNKLAYNEIGNESQHSTIFTDRGVTLTIQNDGTILCSGTNDGTGDSNFRLWANGSLFDVSPYCTGKYAALGCPSGGSADSYNITIYKPQQYNIKDTGSGVILTNTSLTNISFVITVKPNVNVDGKSFKPMIIPKSLYDAGFTDYQPYAMTNNELTTKEQQNESDIISGFSGCQFLADTADKETAYTFSVKRRDTRTRYRYGILMAGVSAAGTALYSIWCDTNNNVTIALIAGTSTRTFTGTLTFNGYDGTLSITPTDRQYGGIRIIWFD